MQTQSYRSMCVQRFRQGKEIKKTHEMENIRDEKKKQGEQ